MTKERFIETMAGACGNAAPAFVAQVRNLATLSYDPALESDDDEQIRRAVRIAYQSADDLRILATRLEATLRKALPTLWRD